MSSSRPVSEVKHTSTPLGGGGGQRDTGIAEAALSAPARRQCKKAPFNWTSAGARDGGQIGRDGEVQRGRDRVKPAQTPLLLFR